MFNGVQKKSVFSAKIDSASTNIPSAFSASNAASLVISGIGFSNGFNIVNYSASRLAYSYSNGSPSVVPSTVDGYVPPASSGGFSAVVKDGVIVQNGVIYIKSDTGSAVATGIVTIEVW